MPKIRDLNPLPGTPDGTEATWIDKGNADFYATLQQIANFTLGNIKVVENENGLSIRIPGIGIQICAYYQAAPVNIDEGSAPNVRSASQRWNYPQSFADAPTVVGSVHIGAGHAFGLRFDGLDTVGINYRLYSTVAGTSARAACIAIGRY